MLYLLDSKTNKARRLFSRAPNLIQGFTLSRDGRSIYFSYHDEEADIWLCNLQ
jgi:hypothetical protein